MDSVLRRWGKHFQSGLQNFGSFFGLWTKYKEEEEDSRNLADSDIESNKDVEVIEDGRFHMLQFKEMVSPTLITDHFNLPHDAYDVPAEKMSELRREREEVKDVNWSSLCSTLENEENITNVKEGHFDKKVTFVTIEDTDKNQPGHNHAKAENGTGTENNSLYPSPEDDDVPECRKEGDFYDGISQPVAEQIKSYESLSVDDTWCQLEDSLVYGKDALKHYNLYVQIENKVRVHELEMAKQKVKEKLKWRIKHIEEIISKARATASSVSGALWFGWINQYRTRTTATTEEWCGYIPRYRDGTHLEHTKYVDWPLSKTADCFGSIFCTLCERGLWDTADCCQIQLQPIGSYRML